MMHGPVPSGNSPGAWCVVSGAGADVSEQTHPAHHAPLTTHLRNRLTYMEVTVILEPGSRKCRVTASGAKGQNALHHYRAVRQRQRPGMCRCLPGGLHL